LKETIKKLEWSSKRELGPNKNGFTIIELLVIISIIGLISSIALASLNTAREDAKIASGKIQESSIRAAVGDTLTGRWDFNEGGGAVAYDSSGSNNNGTIVGAVYATPGIEGSDQALYFNGSSYVTGMGSPNIANNSATVAAWVRPEANTDIRSIFSSGYLGSCLNYGVSLTSSGLAVSNNEEIVSHHGLTMEQQPDDPGGGFDFGGSSPIPNNTWSFVAITFKQGGEVNLFVNGTPIGVVDDLPITNCGTGRWVIGAAASGGTDGEPNIPTTNNFQGLLDNVAVYESAFTANEVWNLYARESVKYSVVRN